MIITPDKAAYLAKAIASQGDDLADSILCSLYAALVESDNDEDLYAAAGNLMDEAGRFHERTEEAIRNGGAIPSYQHAAE
jgi:hypothetical protein